MHSAATIPSRCAACKAEQPLQVWQEIIDGRLTWHEKLECPCGLGFETDGVGLPLKGVRDAILAKSGSAELWVDEPKSVDPVATLLAKVLGLNRETLTARLSKLPAVAYEGTHTEVAFLVRALSNANVSHRVVNRLSAVKG